METTANNSFENQINNSVPKFSYLVSLSWYFKRFVFVVLIGGLLGILEIASLEIPNRYSMFPLYGFYSFSLFNITVLSGYLVISKRFIRLPKWNVARKTKQNKIKEVPAVILVIRRRKVETQKNNSVAVR